MNSPDIKTFFNICRYLRDINVRVIMISSKSDIGFDIYHCKNNFRYFHYV